MNLSGNFLGMVISEGRYNLQQILMINGGVTTEVFSLPPMGGVEMAEGDLTIEVVDSMIDLIVGVAGLMTAVGIDMTTEGLADMINVVVTVTMIDVTTEVEGTTIRKVKEDLVLGFVTVHVVDIEMMEEAATMIIIAEVDMTEVEGHRIQEREVFLSVTFAVKYLIYKSFIFLSFFVLSSKILDFCQGRKRGNKNIYFFNSIWPRISRFQWNEMFQ